MDWPGSPLGGSEKGAFSKHPPPIEAFFDANKHPDERISPSQSWSTIRVRCMERSGLASGGLIG
jgi:hypothetical protein